MANRKPRRTTNRPGRPPLPRAEKRIHRLPLNLSPRELSLLHERAERIGLPAHVLARSLALYGRVSAPPVPKGNYAVVGQLGRIANLLRQGLRHARTGRISSDFRPLIEDGLELIAALRHELVTPRS
jgi:mobilization protein NikA